MVSIEVYSRNPSSWPWLPISLLSTLACLLASPASSALVERTSSHPFYSPSSSSYPFPSTADNDKKNGCGSDKLIVYRVTLNTFWSSETFPKHYPKWRPPAQWSKVIGKYILHLKNKVPLNGLTFSLLRNFHTRKKVS